MIDTVTYNYTIDNTVRPYCIIYDYTSIIAYTTKSETTTLQLELHRPYSL